jgi:transposase
VKDVAIISIIRRWNLREGRSIRAISKRLGISRNTVRKYLRSEVVEPVYGHRTSPSKLDAYVSKLSYWLKIEANKTRKQRRSLKQIHSDLRELGFSGSYDRVAAFARCWRREQRERFMTAGKSVYIPLYFEPGDAFQFDWSEDWALIGKVRTKLHVAQFKLSHSRAFFLRAYLLQTHEMLFDAHHHAFVSWGGIPRRGIYDNMKTAVDRVQRGKERHVNPRFSAMASHYLFDADFCNVASGWEKGQIEKNVQDSRRRIWQKLELELPRFSGQFYTSKKRSLQCL